MWGRRFLSAGLLAAAATMVVAARTANYDGPPVAHTGGFGEPTCRACHKDEPLNDPGGSLRIEGLPQRYEPGRTYVLTVVLRRSGMGRAGFELSTRVADGPEAGSQAGALETSDARASVVPGPPPKAVQYAEQTREGCSVSGPETRWALRWRSPANAAEGAKDRGVEGGGRGDVLIHVAANAANYDDSPLGDFIYVGEWRVRGPPP